MRTDTFISSPLTPLRHRQGWAMETDDAYILARAGCVESLTRRTADGSLEPALAESWTRHSPTEWDFTIRQGRDVQ